MKLNLVHLPAKILRTKATEVSFPIHKDTEKLLFNMLETVEKVDGIGLAANQVASPLNLAIIFLAHMEIEPFAIINPTILSSSQEQTEVEEGCLSMPGVYGLVNRPKKIKFKFYHPDGMEEILEDDGWIARVVQHEIDHLNGVLIKDKIHKITKGEHLLTKFKD